MKSSYESAADSSSLLPAPLLDPERHSSPLGLTSLPSTSILLVEDEPVVSAFLGCALKHLGFRVSPCVDVATALDSFHAQIPTLILTDCNLPHRSGIDLIKVVLAECRTMPIIGMSGEHYKGVEMIEAGAIAFIPKPIEMDALERIVVQIAECGIASTMTNVNASF